MGQRVCLSLPPGCVLVTFSAEDGAELYKAVSHCVVLREEGGVFKRMPDGERDADGYLSFIRTDDPRLTSLIEEVRNEERAKAMEAMARLEATLTGRPTPVDGQLASVLPHRRKTDQEKT